MTDHVRALAERGVAGVLADRAPFVAGWPLWIEVRCGGTAPLQPLVEARRQLEDLGSPGLWETSRRLRGGLRRRLVGESGVDAAERLVAQIREAAATAGSRPLIVLEGAELADPATAMVLQRAASEPGWFPTALLLVFHAWPQDAALAALAGRLDLSPAAPTSEPEPEPEPVTSPESPPLPPEVRLTLRAAALEGPTFDARDLAARLRVDVLTVLERLQIALECGVPLRDHADGRFSMSDEDHQRWSTGLLPSLAAAWSRPTPTPTSPAPAPASAPAPAPAPAPADAGGPPPGLRPDDAPGGPTPTPPETPPTAPPAVEQLLSAARQALDHGDHRAARQLAARAWAQLPDDPEHRTLRVATLLELATSAWHGSGDHATLDDARSLAEQAAALLTTEDDASLVASVLSVLAGVLADQGKPEGLSRAVDLLTDAIRRLQDAGDPLGAAALLDDQAAVWVRLGDPVRAAHLLRTSRDLFAQRAASEPEARRQLARTELTLARLPLHARPRKGLEQESLQAALTSARSARDAFQALQLPQELGRALQTEGRLLALLDFPEEAVATLAEAARLQQGMGDALGLAGTAGALAELHAARGEPGTALKLLSDSIELNRRAGSALGLAYNRAALEGLRELGGPAVQRLDAQLEAAQRVVGRRPR